MSKAKESAQYFKSKPATGPYKQCPNAGCGVYVHARKTTCPKCGQEFPAPNKSNKPKHKDQPIDARLTIATIKAMGGLDKVKAQIVAAEKAEDILKALGGLVAAKSAVSLVEELRSL